MNPKPNRSARRSAVLLLLLLISVLTEAQVVSPTPTSASGSKFGEQPVNLSTGVAGISVPLHMIQSISLSYPLSISYHASGIKVAETAGAVGLGWSLDAGGQISRVMRVGPDEKPNGFFSFASSIPNATDAIPLATKQGVDNRVYDMMPDLFYFNTGTVAGKLIFDNQLVAHTIPQSALKIVSNSTLSNFSIVDPSGTSYVFEPGETATTAIAPEFTSTWYLARIVSADKQDTIRFNYTLRASNYSYSTNEGTTLNFYYDIPAGASGPTTPVIDYDNDVQVTVKGTRYLSSIEHKRGKVLFTYGTRSDISGENKLDYLTVYARDPVTKALIEEKKINFAYSYFENVDTGTRLRLDQVQEQFGAATFTSPYRFIYSPKRLPDTDSFAQDHWGYYNGALENESLIPAYTFSGVELSTSNREVNAQYTDACIIKTVFNPAGGATDYEFEQNTCVGCTNGFGPGLRVKRITVRDPFSSISAVTNYDYINPLTDGTSGVLVYQPAYFKHIPVVDDTHGNNYQYNCLQIQANPNSLGNFTGSPVIYEYVTVFQNDDPNSMGMTVSKFSVYSQPIHQYPYFPLDEKAWMAGNLLTQEIYKVENGIRTYVRRVENTYEESPYYFTTKGLNVKRSKIYFFTEPGANDYIITNYFAEAKFQYLKQTKVYDYEQGSGTINSVSTQTFFYDRSNVHLFPTKIETLTSESNVIYRQEFKYPLDYTQTGVYAAMSAVNLIGVPVEQFSSKVISGTPYIVGYAKTDFLEWTPGKIYPKYFYVPKIPGNTLKSTFDSNPSGYLQLNSQINTIKSGVPVESQKIGMLPSTGIFDTNLAAVSAVVESASADQVAYTSFESLDFGNWNVNCGTQTVTKNVSLSLEATFQTIKLSTSQTINYSYTNTNSGGASPLLTFTKDGVSPITRILSGTSGSNSVSLAAGEWGVSLTYEYNISAANVTFSYQYSFPTAPTLSLTGPKTGIRSAQILSGHSITKTGLPTGRYVVSYYQKGGTISFTATGGATVVSSTTGTAESDGWTKVQHIVNVTSTSQGVQLTASGIYIDELRLHPEGSYMKTTCYNAFGNTVSSADQNMKCQYFEYDDKHTLKITRDHEKQILQQVEYKLGVN